MDNKQRISAFSVFALLGLSSSAMALEITHNAFTSLCLSSGKVHGTCISTHSDGNTIDTHTLNFDCKMEKNGNIIGSLVYTIEDIGTDGDFTDQFNLFLRGSGSNRYCTRN